MLRRLFVGVALIAVFASLSLWGQRPAPVVEASPANQSGSVYFTDQQDGDQKVEYRKDEGVVWAHLDGGVSAGANLSYILRLNGWDYKWGKLNCCKDGGPVAFPVFNKDGKSKGIPGGAYELYVYDGDKELGRGGFGIKGGKGSDNDNDH